MKCALYARVSTNDQNCEMQLRELREYCTRRGWEIAGEYVDTGWGGAKASRPQLDKIMQHATERCFDVIVVWKLDRWARSMGNLVASLQTLNSLGVRWIATTQNIDTDENNPVGRLLLHILGAVAEFERSIIQERVKAGMNSARRKGKTMGRPKAVFERWKVVEMQKAGASVRQIAGLLGVGVGTIHRLLKAA